MILFITAGTIYWLRGWLYLGYTLLMEIISLILLAKKAPETLRQRGRWHEGIKTFDKIFLICWLALSFITPVVTGLDERFGWSHMSMSFFYLGAGLLTVVWPFAIWAMIENEYFEQFVRIQSDRAHQVVTTGPYRFIRHPGYAGSIIGAFCTPLMLGTWTTFIPAGLVILLFIIRTALEDRTLRQGLEGYEAYAQQTRYRFFPGIW